MTDPTVHAHVYPLPEFPPERWFRHLNLTEDAYREKCAWLVERLHHIEQLPFHKHGRSDAAYMAGAQALGEVIHDEVATWMTCCWAAISTVQNLGPLPAGQRWAITTDNVPDEVSVNVPEPICDAMRVEAGRFLTTLGRGETGPRLRDWGFPALVLLLAYLLDALAHSRQSERPQPVTAVPEASEW